MTKANVDDYYSNLQQSEDASSPTSKKPIIKKKIKVKPKKITPIVKKKTVDSTESTEDSIDTSETSPKPEEKQAPPKPGYEVIRSDTPSKEESSSS